MVVGRTWAQAAVSLQTSLENGLGSEGVGVYRDGFADILVGRPGTSPDALDVVSMTEQLPESLKLGDLLYSQNIGAYSHASATYFNGFPPATVVHVNR